MNLRGLNRYALRGASFVMAAVIVCSLAGAENFQVTGRAVDATAQDAAIHPYLDEGTFLVVRVDLDRVEPASLEKMLKGMMESREKISGIPEDMKKEMRERAVKEVEETKTWIADMTAAGGKRMYVLVDQADQTGASGGPIMIVPLAEGADKEKITEVLSRNTGGGRQKVEEIGKGIALANSSALERLASLVNTGKAAPRPELADAMAAAMKSYKDGPMWIAYVPGESTRTAIEDGLPMLPPQLGGGETKMLSRGVKYAAAGVSQKPGVIAHLTIKADTAERAKELNEMMSKGLAFAKEAAAGTAFAEETTKKIDAMKVKVEGDTITLALDPIFAQNAMTAIMMSRMGAGRGPNPPGAAPAKKDDGGL